MKNLIFGDIHLDININNEDINEKISRIPEQREHLEYVYAYATECKINRIIITGDVFHTNRPSPLAIAVFIGFLLKCLKAGIVVVIIEGNHDFNMRNDGAMAPLMHLKSLFDKQLVIVCDYVLKCDDWAFVPHMKDVQKVVKECDSKYLVGHFNVKGAMSGAEKFLISSKVDDVYEFNENIKKAFLGHIHKMQRFRINDTIVCYSGSVIYNDFGERLDEKGFIIFDDTKDEIKFEHFNCIPFVQIEKTEQQFISDTEDPDIDNIQEWKSVEGAYVKVIINEYTGRVSLIQIEDFINNLKPRFIKDIVLNRNKSIVVEKKRQLSERIKSMTLIERVTEYYKKNNEQNIDELVEMTMEYLSEDK